MSTQLNIKIVNGPSADRMFDACKYAYDAHLKKHIGPWFDIVLDETTAAPYTSFNRKTTRVIARTVMSIAHESGDGQSFVITAAILDGVYEFYYNTARRSGHFVRKIS